MTTAPHPPLLASGSVAPSALARLTGTFSIVAMDQRESLRAMMAERAAGSGPVTDEDMAAFKLAVARELTPHASAFLTDRHVGYDRLVTERALYGCCGLVLAVDTLDQPPGGVVEETGLDEEVDLVRARADGVAALKLLVVWRRDERRAERVALADRFVRLCREAGLASVLEPVARATPDEDAIGSFDLNASIVEAARELGPLGPSLYKCQVPDRGLAPMSQIARQAERIDAALDCPWVVLSQGVHPQDFPHSVEAVCRGGASGFLAGRALWTDALAGPDPLPVLRQWSAAALLRLGEIVDRFGRPWYETRAAIGCGTV